MECPKPGDLYIISQDEEDKVFNRLLYFNSTIDKYTTRLTIVGFESGTILFFLKKELSKEPHNVKLTYVWLIKNKICRSTDYYIEKGYIVPLLSQQQHVE